MAQQQQITVVTLVATKPHPPLQSKHIQQMEEKLQHSGAQLLAPTQWLGMGEAAELMITGLAPAAAEAVLQPVFLQDKIDIIAQNNAHRRKKLLLSDMDSTMIMQECLDELADCLGVKPQVAAITEQAMQGLLEFAPALQARVALLAGHPVTLIEQVKQRLTLMQGAKTLVNTMRHHGAYCALVSGGFRPFTAHIAQQIGFDADYGNQLDTQEGQFTGQVLPPILGKEAKQEILMQLMAERGLVAEDTLAVGDGANDLPMLLAAGLGVAFHAKEAVHHAAHYRVRFSDLTALLYAQGYAQSEFVVA